VERRARRWNQLGYHLLDLSQLPGTLYVCAGLVTWLITVLWNASDIHVVATRDESRFILLTQ